MTRNTPTHIDRMRRRLAHLRAFVSFALVAAAQFLSPAAAADPASKIDPPAWSYRHTKEEIQAFGAGFADQDPAKKDARDIREMRIRRLLRQQADKR